jgi:hypothetical protein
VYISAVREHLYASITRDEVWIASDGSLTPVVEKIEAGRAVTRFRDGSFELAATGGLSPELHRELERAVISDKGALLLEAAGRGGRRRIRLIQHARAVVHGDGDRDTHSWRMLLVSTPGGRSVAVAPGELHQFEHLLSAHSPALPEVVDHRELPIEWAAGSAAVLMHEAVGHPAEQLRHDVDWPQWLSVLDGGRNPAVLDDCGEPLQRCELTRGQQPSAWRRTSYRDVPMQRMTDLTVTATGVTALLPPRRIRIFLLSSGRYDPLSDSITLAVSGAELVTGSASSPLAPFILNASRASVAAALAGECGPIVTYPGVACFDEGQRLFVGSRACGLLTRPLREVE